MQSLGFQVWWDVELLASDDFTDAIQAAFSKARAVVVIWSETSVKSNFVRDEARFGLKHRKLVATKTSRLEADRIPFGFQGQHTEDIANRDKIVRAIEKLGATRQAAKLTLGEAKSEKQKATPGTVGIYRRQSNLSARDVLDDSERTFRMFVWHEPEDAIFAKDLCSELSNFFRSLLDSSARDGEPITVIFDLDMKPESIEFADFLLMLSPRNNKESFQRSDQIRHQFLRHWEHDKDPSMRVEHVLSRFPSLEFVTTLARNKFHFDQFIRPDGHLIKNDSSALIVSKLGNSLFSWVLNFSHPNRKKR